MNNKYSIVALLQAKDQNFSSTMKKVNDSIDNIKKKTSGSFGSGIFDSLKSGADKSSFSITGLVAKMGALIGIAGTLNGAISRYDTLNNFPKVLQQIGFGADESKNAINKLSDGVKGLPTALDEVAGTAQRIAVLTGNLEGATDITLALNDAFISSGSDANNAARGLEQYVQMLSKGEVDLMSWRTLQETMGVALNDVAKSFGFAGASAQNDLYAALKSGNITFDQFNAKIIELDKSVGGFADRAKTSSGGIRTAFTNLKTAIVRNTTTMIEAIDKSLAENGLGNIETIIKNITSTINKLMGAVAKVVGKVFGPQIQKLSSSFSGMGSTVDKVVSIIENMDDKTLGLIGSLITMSVTAGPAFSVFSSVSGILGGAMKGIDIFTSGITGLGKVSVEGAKKVKGGFSELTQNIKNIFGTFNSLGNIFPELDKKVSLTQKVFGKLPTGVQSAFSSMSSIVRSGSSTVLSKVGTMVTTAMKLVAPAALIGLALVGLGMVYTQFSSEIDSLVQIAITKGPEIITNLAKGIQSKIPLLITQGTTLIIQLANAFIANFPAIVQAGVGIISSLVSGVATNIPSLFPVVINVISTIVNSLVSGIPTLIMSGMELLLALAQGLSDNVPLIISTIVDMIGNLVSTIITNLPQILQTGLQIIIALATGLVQAVPQLIGAIPGIIAQIWRAFTSVNWLDVGVNIIKGIASGIASMATALFDSVVSVVKGAVDGVKNFLGIHSPSRLFKNEIGKFIPIGMAVGIEANSKVVDKAMQNMIDIPKSYADEMNYSLANVNGSINTNVSHQVSGSTFTTDMMNAVNKLASQESVIVMDDGTVVGKTARKMNNALGNLSDLEGRFD